MAERFYSSTGSRYIPEYSPKIEDDGTITLSVTGKHDLQADIESHAESADIHVIMSRFQNGDVSVLSRAQGFYGDVSGAPKSYAEILQRVQDGQRLFDSLSVEQRAKFGNDFNRFFASIGSDDWFSALGISSEPSGSEPSGSAPVDSEPVDSVE